MSRTHKASKANGVDPRQKLTGDFVTALQADWLLHGPEIIEALRTQSPVKYAEIVSRLAVPDAAPAPDDYSQYQTQLDIGRKLLAQVGVPEDAMTDSMIEQAAEANVAFRRQIRANCRPQLMGMPRQLASGLRANHRRRKSLPPVVELMPSISINE